MSIFDELIYAAFEVSAAVVIVALILLGLLSWGVYELLGWVF